MTSVSRDVVLSDSLQRLRPSFFDILKTDVNIGDNLTDIRRIEKQRRSRELKFPSVVGRGDVDSFNQVSNPTDFAYKRYNDEGDYRPPAPFRSSDNFVSPVDGFVSVSGEVNRNTGHSHIPSMVQLDRTPQSDTPQAKNSIRTQYAFAPPDVVRVTEEDPGVPYPWSGRKVIDAALRANLGGWTSDQDPRSASAPTPVRGVYREITEPPAPAPGEENRELRDKLSLRYRYTSSTQRSYEEVPWDNVLPGRKWAPTTTLEERPDMTNQRYTLKRYAPRAEEWQKLGRSWDMVQKRRGYYKDGPIPGMVFCSTGPRTGQIPGYSGCVGAKNLEEIDNTKEPFFPLTIKRAQIPRYTDTAHRPTIPGFAGKTPQGDAIYPTGPVPPPEHFTSSGLYRKTFAAPNHSEYKRESHMSKMVTTVPPYNPFNKVPRMEVTC